MPLWQCAITEHTGYTHTVTASEELKNNPLENQMNAYCDKEMCLGPSFAFVSAPVSLTFIYFPLSTLKIWFIAANSFIFSHALSTSSYYTEPISAFWCSHC